MQLFGVSPRQQQAQANRHSTAQPTQQTALDFMDPWPHHPDLASCQQATPTPCQHMMPSPQLSIASQHSELSQQSQHYDQLQQEGGSQSSFAQVSKHLDAQRVSASAIPTPCQPVNNLDVITQQMAAMSMGKPALPATPAAALSPHPDLTTRELEPARPYSLFTTPRGLKHTIFSSQPSWRSQQPPCLAINFEHPPPGALALPGHATGTGCSQHSRAATLISQMVLEHLLQRHDPLLVALSAGHKVWRPLRHQQQQAVHVVCPHWLLLQEWQHLMSCPTTPRQEHLQPSQCCSLTCRPAAVKPTAHPCQQTP